jgi:hypothetical protein
MMQATKKVAADSLILGLSFDCTRDVTILFIFKCNVIEIIEYLKIG